MKLSLVIPVFNEGSLIRTHLNVIVDTVRSAIDCAIEIFLVDDGSSDNTYSEVGSICTRYEFVRYVPLSRHFGKEAAIFAGLESSSGDAIVVMDSDLQHPPKLVSEMLEACKDSFMVVHGCKASRGKESVTYGLFSKVFYAILGKLTGLDIAGHSDHNLLGRDVVNRYCGLSERSRFFKRMIPYLGFRSHNILF